MKIIRTLKITADEFFNELEDQVLQMANNKETATKKYTTRDIKKGLKLVSKSEYDATRTEYELRDYNRGHLYVARVKTIDDTATLTYTTKAVEDGLEVIFEQRLENFEKRKMNKFLRGWSEMTYLAKMSNSLLDTESKIIRQRNNETYDPQPINTALKKFHPIKKINEKIIKTAAKANDKSEEKKENKNNKD